MIASCNFHENCSAWIGVYYECDDRFKLRFFIKVVKLTRIVYL